MKKNLFIVTGTGSGIGKAIAKQLISNPENDIIGISRKNEIQADNFKFWNIDLRSINEVKKIVLPENNGYQCVSLINNAGIIGEINTLDKIAIDSIETTIEVNYTSPMILSTLFVQKYQNENCLKTIINISSGASSSPYKSWANYCSSKAAIEMFSRCLAEEQKDMPFLIHSYAIAPGVVNTAMQEYIRETNIENFSMLPKFVELYRENRLYKPEDVANELIRVCMNPLEYNETVFRIQI